MLSKKRTRASLQCDVVNAAAWVFRDSVAGLSRFRLHKSAKSWLLHKAAAFTTRFVLVLSALL